MKYLDRYIMNNVSNIKPPSKKSRTTSRKKTLRIWLMINKKKEHSVIQLNSVTFHTLQSTTIHRQFSSEAISMVIVTSICLTVIAADL